MIKKTIFLIPGFKMQITDKPYRWLVEYLKSKKFKVVKVPIKWQRTTLTQLAESFKKFYDKKKKGENYLLGFSYGAVISLLVANDLKPRKIFLCSLSPDFKEDGKETKNWVKVLGKKRVADIKTRNGREFAKNLQIPSTVFYGEKEGEQYPQLKIRNEETARLARNSRLVVVKKAPHQIDYPAYMQAIKREFEIVSVRRRAISK
ncbi:MAG: hypothetical protein WC640_02745 [Candidatus Paceibacterota bacterium]|jgi:pimeloyl-ACP methyl ester carboxylesterase